MSAPVTAEELAEVERLDREATPGPWAYDEEDDVIETARGSSVAILTRAARPGLTHVKPDGRAIAAYRTAAPRLARDLTAARTEAEELRHNLRAVRDSACRAQEQITAERATSARLADKVIDLGRELEALRAAVWAHRAAHEAGEGETVALVRLYQLAGLA